MGLEIGEMLLQMLSFPLLNVYKEQRIFKAKAIPFYFAEFHVYGIVYKMHKKGIFNLLQLY